MLAHFGFLVFATFAHTSRPKHRRNHSGDISYSGRWLSGDIPYPDHWPSNSQKPSDITLRHHAVALHNAAHTVINAISPPADVPNTKLGTVAQRRNRYGSDRHFSSRKRRGIEEHNAGMRREGHLDSSREPRGDGQRHSDRYKLDQKQQRHSTHAVNSRAGSSSFDLSHREHRSSSQEHIAYRGVGDNTELPNLPDKPSRRNERDGHHFERSHSQNPGESDQNDASPHALGSYMQVGGHKQTRSQKDAPGAPIGGIASVEVSGLGKMIKGRPPSVVAAHSVVGSHRVTPNPNPPRVARHIHGDVVNSMPQTFDQRRSPLLGRLKRNLGKRDILALRSSLVMVDEALADDPHSFDVNLVLTFNGSATARRYTLLGAAAEDCWVLGIDAFLVWNQARRDAGARLQIDEGGDVPPLVRAASAGCFAGVSRLLEANASLFANGNLSSTALEAAVAAGNADVVQSLFGFSPILSFSALREKMELASSNTFFEFLRYVLRDAEESNHLRQIQEFVPKALWPRDDLERAVVGESPTNWILFYENRLMHQVANCPGIRNSLGGGMSKGPCEEVGHILISNGFDVFARDFSETIITLWIVCCFCSISGYAAFRLRMYGGLDVPVSLAHTVPGALEPARFADTKFDAGLLNSLFLYRAASPHLSTKSWPVWATVVGFLKAVLGYFNVFFYQLVQLPSEHEHLEEQPSSDTYGESLRRFRAICATYALRIRNSEVFLRTVALLVALWWLGFQKKRWEELEVFLTVIFLNSVVASCVAGGIAPSPSAGSSPNPHNTWSRGDWDTGRTAYALFAVQHGPHCVPCPASHGKAEAQTTDTLSIVRARAAASGYVTASRNAWRSKRRVRLRPEKTCVAIPVEEQAFPSPTLQDDKSSDQAAHADPRSHSLQEAAHAESKHDRQASVSATPASLPYVEWWRCTFLRAGFMHTPHTPFLVGSICSAMTVAMVLIWLSHLRSLVGGSFHEFYQRTTGTDAFQVYGAPGTFVRIRSLCFELLWLSLVGERILSITNIVRVTALSLRQRHRALSFVARHAPPSKEHDSKSAHAQAIAAVRRLAERRQCRDFAMELSSLRWKVLRAPLTLVLLATTKLFLYASLCYGLQYIGCPAWQFFSLDPMVPLCLGICFLGPLLSALSFGAVANQVVERLCAWERQEAGAALAAWEAARKPRVEGIAGSDTKGEGERDHALESELRAASVDFSNACEISWANGRPLGVAEPIILLSAAVSAGSLAVAVVGPCLLRA